MKTPKKKRASSSGRSREGFFGKFKNAYCVIKAASPGERFRGLHRHRRAGLLSSIVAILVGVILFVGGLVLIWLPVVPGIPICLAGAAVLAAQSRPFASTLDSTELWLRNVIRKTRERFGH
jgi:hypothetical protein